MKKDRSSEDNLGVRNLIRRGCEGFSAGKKRDCGARGGKTSKRMKRLSVKREAERFLPQGQQWRSGVRSTTSEGL